MLTPALRCALLAASLALAAAGARAQDLHFSLVDYVPLWQNPALAGAYSGTVRVGALYRDQWGAVLGESYKTPSAFVDAPIVMLGEKAWLGVGGHLITDRAGFARLTTTSIQAAASYHRVLAESRRGPERTVLSLGLAGGLLQRGADLSGEDLVLAEEQEVAFGGGGVGVGGSLDRRDDLSASGLDLGFGVSLARVLDEDRTFRVGASARHLTTPGYGLLDSANVQRPTTFAAQAAYRQALGTQLLLEPTAFLQTTRGGGVETQVRATVGMRIGDEDDRILRAGLGVRLPTRFVYPTIGYQQGDLRVAASFDVSANGLQRVDGLANAFEVAVRYVFKVYKQPKVEPALLCPQI